MAEDHLDFEIDTEFGFGPVTCYGGVPVLLEYFGSSGAASIVDGEIALKRRKRGLSASEMVQSFLALWACGGEPCEDFEHLRGDGLALLLGHDLPAPQTALNFLAGFEEADLPLLGGDKSAVREESRRLRGLGLANRAILADLQGRMPERAATIDIDATIPASCERATSLAHDGRRGARPVAALWAEADMILADEFRDGHVSASGGNRRVIERALAALPAGVEEIYLRADSAFYDHSLMVFLDRRQVGFAISVMVSEGLLRRIKALQEGSWHPESDDGRLRRDWAELDYLPDGAIEQKEGVVRRLRYLAIRITRKQGEFFADGSRVRHFCIVTNRCDPEGGTAGDLLAWHSGKARTLEHVHHVLTSELAGEALPSQLFGANAAWFRMNCLLYNLMSAFMRLRLPEGVQRIRPKRLRFLVLNNLLTLTADEDFDVSPDQEIAQGQ